MNIIAAVDRDWAIGCENHLLEHIPEDMKFFRKTTIGNVVVMGRKTLESFPGGRPLKDRVNVVITSRQDYQVPGAVIVHSLEEALDYLGQYDPRKIYVIGGESIYRQMLDLCDRAFITFVDISHKADAYFPNLDQREDWELTEVTGQNMVKNLHYEFRLYEKRTIEK